MDDNPYEAPQVERSEAKELAGTAEDSRDAQQYELLDLRVLAVALTMVVLAFGLPFLMAVIVSALI